MKREIGLGFLSRSCAITDISHGQFYLGVSLEPELTLGEFKGFQSWSPEDTLLQKKWCPSVALWNLVATNCHSQVPSGAQVWQHRPKQCFIWPTIPFPEGRVNGWWGSKQLGTFSKSWHYTALPKLLLLPLAPRKGRQKVGHVWSNTGGFHLCTCEESSKLEDGPQSWQG